MSKVEKKYDLVIDIQEQYFLFFRLSLGFRLAGLWHIVTAGLKNFKNLCYTGLCVLNCHKKTRRLGHYYF